ncbi:hypothetical protein CONLIGDRAFT_677797 [Coniochaeta ligniaria NRRL 30616]|uniref:HNH nuclease domain-containing protein n=1 Tax=Coniochaeta ligniaria NRRL 30616 TaxID=1408157 RepID=A0A1J7JXD5_9PEZI|nr:hypothetical protein CONLIGDRAFT_677797 [Coniochaeta ligniaria NRRL 30616]
MSSPTWKADPLALLPTLSQHPRRSGSDESQASDTSTEAEQLSLASSSTILNLQLELIKDKLKEYKPLDANDDTAKVLNAFLDNLYGLGLATLAHEIDKFSSDPLKLRQLRNCLVDAILKPMAAAGGKQPGVTPSTNDLADDAIEAAMSSIEGSSRKGQATLKADCLRRDNNRCVIMGIVDSKVWKEMPTEERTSKHGATECAHILPFALRKLDDRSATHTKNKAAIWWALYEYFPILNGKIAPNTINQAANAMTLAAFAHRVFGAFSFGLKATEKDHEYQIEVLDPESYETSLLPPQVTFLQHDTRVPMPDKDLLDVHLRIGRILKVSGIGAAVRQSLARYEDRTEDNISSDGSTNLERILGDKLLMYI